MTRGREAAQSGGRSSQSSPLSFREPQSIDLAVPAGGLGRSTATGERVPGVVTGERVGEDGGSGHRPGEDAHRVQRPGARQHAVTADPPRRRLEPHHSAVGRGPPDRGAGLGADRGGRHSRRHRRCRAAAGAAGHAGQVPRVRGRPHLRIHARRPVGKLVEVRLAQQHAAGGAEPRHHRRILLRHRAGEDAGSGSRRQPRHAGVIASSRAGTARAGEEGLGTTAASVRRPLCMR